MTAGLRPDFEQRPVRQRALRRVALFLCLVVGAAVTGFVWAAERRGAAVEAEARGQVQAEIGPDGVLVVTEQLLLAPGAATGEEFARVLPTPPGTHVRWREATSEDGRRVDGGLTELGDHVRVRLAAPGPDGDRYRLRYDVIGAVALHEDVTAVSWEWLDDRNAIGWLDVSVDLTWLESAGPPLLVDVASEGPSGPVLERAGGLHWEAGPVLAHHAVELRLGLAPAAVPELPSSTGEALGSMEAEMARDGGLGAFSGALGEGLTILPLILGTAFVLGWAWLQHSRGREHRVGHVGPEFSPPSPHPPAEVGWLLRFGLVKLSDLTATIVDLVRRGHLLLVDRGGRILVRAGGGPSTRGRPTTDDALRPYERTVLRWLFDDGDDEVDLAAREGSIRQEPQRWAAFWQRFNAELDRQGHEDGLVERPKDAESVLAVGLVSAFVLVAGVIGMAHARPAWLALVIAGGFVLVASDAFARRSPEGAQLAARWEAFGAYLRAPEAFPDGPEPSRVPWGDLLAHAIPLGAADSVLVRARETVTEPADASGQPPEPELFVQLEVSVGRWRSAHIAATSINAEPSQRVRLLVARVRRRPPPR